MQGSGFIARRYLFSRQHVSLVSTLTLISVGGITIGTALLIIVLSVFNGFYDLVKGLLLTNDPDIRIESATAPAFAYTDSLRSELAHQPDVVSMSPYVQGKCLIVGSNSNSQEQVVTVKGIHPDLFFPIRNHPGSVTSGVFNLNVQNNTPGLLIPQRLFGQLSLTLNDNVALMSSAGMEKALTQFSGPQGYHFQVRGVYSLNEIVNEPQVYIDLHAAQRLFRYKNKISGIDIELKNHDQAAAFKQSLQQKLGSNYQIQTWYDLQKPLYDVMNLEKWAGYGILMIIVLVAVLNIVGSLTMLVIQKRRDIGVLISMGYTRRIIKRIFVRQAFYIGVMGCGLGGALGLLLCWLQKNFGLVKLAGSGSFIIQYYPVAVQWTDIAMVLGGSLILCMLASWYPALRASWVEPAEAVRYE